MDAELAGAGLEDQPTAAGVGTGELEDVAEERPGSLGVLGVDERGRAVIIPPR